MKCPIFHEEHAPNLFFHHLDDLNVEITKHLVVVQKELVTAGLFGDIELLGPVFVAFDPSTLHLSSHHGDHIRPVLPHHLPETVLSARQRALSGDEEQLLWAHLHTNVAGIDVALVLSHKNTRFIVWMARKTEIVECDRLVLILRFIHWKTNQFYYDKCLWVKYELSIFVSALKG